MPITAMFFHKSKLHKQFLKTVTQGTFLPNLVENSPNTFREDDFTPHKSTTCRCQQLVVVFKQIKISLTIFEKGQPRNISEIISKSDQPFQ